MIKWTGHAPWCLRLPCGRFRSVRLIDSCITQLKAQGPSRTCNESKEEVRRCLRPLVAGADRRRTQKGKAARADRQTDREGKDLSRSSSTYSLAAQACIKRVSKTPSGRCRSTTHEKGQGCASASYLPRRKPLITSSPSRWIARERQKESEIERKR